MHKRNANKHEEYKNFKMHLDAKEHHECSKLAMFTQDPIKLLGTAALAGLLLGWLIT